MKSIAKKGVIALEDGTVLHGTSFGYDGDAHGELVFNTSMSGYQEIITDPSYTGQIVMFTYPQIGNYGVNSDDVESKKIHAAAIVVHEYVNAYSNWRATMSLAAYLKRNKIVGLSGVDTRCLTRRIRIKGAMNAVISTTCCDEKKLVARAKNMPHLVEGNLAKLVTCKKQYVYAKALSKKSKRVVVIDFGVKQNILEMTKALGCEVIVVPMHTTARDILALKPNGILLSNGPGNPAAVGSVIDEVKTLVSSKKPIFGICLGHQILGLALGGKTYKLKFGHHGGNHPVKDLSSDAVAITSQNHGFCVDMNSLKGKSVVLTHLNLYDKTPEGIRHTKLPVFSVQYHPEASPGPHDAGYLFAQFKTLMDKN